MKTNQPLNPFRPSMAACLEVAIGDRQWTNAELEQRSEDPGFILNEAEAYAFRTTANTTRKAKLEDLSRAVQLIRELPEELQDDGAECVSLWLSPDVQVEFSRMLAITPPTVNRRWSLRKLWTAAITAAVLSIILIYSLQNRTQHREIVVDDKSKQKGPDGLIFHKEPMQAPNFIVETSQGPFMVAMRGGTEATIPSDTSFRISDVTTEYQVGVIYLIDSNKATIKTYQTNRDGTLHIGCRGSFIGPACDEYIVGVFSQEDTKFLSDKSVPWLNASDISALQQQTLSVADAEKIVESKLQEHGIQKPFEVFVSRFHRE
jgi:hypothetical protein